jgi:threonine dehydratase
MLPSAYLSERFGGEVYLKAECLQHAGSFKVRGATNRLAALSAEERQRGVIAASVGNHAQGVAVAARAVGTPATVVMPEHAALAKVEATRGYGARVILHGAGLGEAVAKAKELAEREGLLFVPGFDDELVIAGQGTLGLEIAEECPEAALAIVPVGGGGLIAGVALALKTLLPDIRVVGVQAAAAPAVARSLAAGQIVEVKPQPTLADGVAVPAPGKLTLPLIQRYVDEIVTVDEETIAQAVALLLERCKLVAEGAGALGVAALLSGAIRTEGRKTVVVISGGNIDINLLARIVEHGLSHANRYLALTVDLDDQPGRLAALLDVVGKTGANVLEVDHIRQGIPLPLRGVEVRLLLETRNAEHIEELTRLIVAAGYRLTESTATARSFRPVAWP